MHDLEHALAMADRILVLHGHPAMLAADVAVPGRDDPAAIARLRGALLERFGFLGTEESENEIESG
jgi:ABC-type nitrate/sulfonate/bicarbonate transport system ATPase subunit